MSTEPLHRYIPARDGLTLHYAEYNPSERSRAPLVCLPGLTRNALDFDPAARALAFDVEEPRRIIAIDYRGRGQSDYDSDWTHYNLLVESDDILTIVKHAGIQKAIFLGVSRGGLNLMTIALQNSSWIEAAIFNDIGPELEIKGLLYIKTYVGVALKPANWDAAAQALKKRMSAAFPIISDEEWMRYARMTFAETKEKGLVERYDLALANTLSHIAPDMESVEMWTAYDALADKPLLLLHGENSNLLSARTIEDMGARHPDLRKFTVKGQGHAPLLMDRETLFEIKKFMQRDTVKS